MGAIRGGASALLLVAVLFVGVMMFLPSGVINLRMQESLFPLVGILAFVCGMILMRVNIAVGIFGFFVTASSVIRFTPDSYAFMILAMFYLSFYYVTAINYDYINDHREILYDVLCLFALINVLWIILQVNGIYLLFVPTIPGSAETGWFANRNESGVFLAMTFPLFFRRKMIVAIIPMVYGLVLAKCTNAAISAVIISGIYLLCIVKPKKVALWAIGIVLACSLAAGGYMKYIHKGGYESRLAAYSASMDLIASKPFLGWGIGQSPYVVPLWMNAEKQDVKINESLYRAVYFQQDFRDLYIERHDFKNTFVHLWTHLHNEYLQFAIDAGIVGAILLLSVFGSHLFIAWRSGEIIPALVIAAAAVSANAFFTFQIGRFLFITVLFAAIIAGKGKGAPCP